MSVRVLRRLGLLICLAGALLIGGMGPAAAPPRPNGRVFVSLEVHPSFRGEPPFDVPRALELPTGFRVAVFARAPSPRQLAFNANGVLFSANIWEGTLVAHPDRDGDGVSDSLETVGFAADLWAPHSLFFHGNDLYVGAHDRILRFSDADGDLQPDGPPATLASLPTFGDQITRTVIVGPDNRLYVGIGSTSNAGRETDPRRGAVVRYELDGSGETVVASGLRNPVGLAVHPLTGAIWATDVGADHLGEEHPLEEVNILRPEAHYGWPLCYEDRAPDLGLYPREAPGFCPGTTAPVATLPAHTTPLGLAFATGERFPVAYRGRLFVALHGSSKRAHQAGYAVLTIEIGPGGEAPRVEPFATGWLLDPSRHPSEPGQHWGRPVHAIPGPDGALYVSSDSPGAIYRVSRDEEQAR